MPTVHEHPDFRAAFHALPLIAILRGIGADEAVEMAQAIVEAGIRIIEVPLNSRDAFLSIGRIANVLSGRAVTGAGTVLSREHVIAAAGVGARLILSPNTNPTVIAQTRELGLASIPGIMTPSEAFSALEAGASALKIFPAELATPASVKALSAVLPAGTLMILVGGVTIETPARYSETPIAGFGIGSSLYSPGTDARSAGERAAKFVRAMRSFQPRLPEISSQTSGSNLKG